MSEAEANSPSQVEFEQTRLLYSALPGVLGLTVLVAILITVVFWGVRPAWLILSWLVLYLAVSVARLMLTRAYWRAPLAQRYRDGWYRGFCLLSCAAGAVWGVTPWLLFDSTVAAQQTLAGFMISGLAAGGVVNLSSRWQCSWMFLIPTLLPFSLWFAFSDAPLSMAIALFVLLLLAAMMVMSVQRSRAVRTQIQATLELEKQTEQARLQRLRYQTLVESTLAIIWEGDPESFRFSYVSPEAETVLGYPVERWLNDSEFWVAHMHPDDRDWAPRYCQTATARLARHSFDYRMLAADGRTVWLRDVVNVVARNGKPVKLVGIMIDITELKQVENNLEYLSGLQKLIVSLSRDLVEAAQDDLAPVFDNTLARLGRWCRTDRAYLIQFDRELRHYTNTHEWVAEDIRAEKARIQNVSTDTIPRMLERLEHKQAVMIPEVAALDDAWSRERELLLDQEIQSLIVLPIFSGARLIGLIGFDSVQATRQWTEDEAAALQVLGDMIGAVLERRQADRKLFELAHFDSLSGLPNRALLMDRLHQALHRARRNDVQVALLYLDLDQFKRVNDTLGHEAGDRLLQSAATRLRELFRAEDTVARIGGDEFVILIDKLVATVDIVSAATKVLDAFRSPIAISGREFMVTASIGIALSPHDGVTAEELLRNADTAMYHAKRNGRDAYQFFTRSMNERIQRRLAIESALRGAVSRAELEVFFQPLIRLSDRSCIGAEALLRWHHPDLADVSPAEFIEVAEQSDLIDMLGDFVLDQSFRHLAEWRRELVPELILSINFSPRQFRNPRLVERVIECLERGRLNGHALDIEITEGVLLPGTKHVKQTLNALRNRGVGVVMDDFGTGYASLGYLRDYPFTGIKIDQAFVRDLEQDPRDRQLVTSAIHLGKSLGLKVLAEGVETEQQFEILAGEGCQFAQGYYFSAPLPADEFGAMLGRQARQTPA